MTQPLHPLSPAPSPYAEFERALGRLIDQAQGETSIIERAHKTVAAEIDGIGALHRLLDMHDAARVSLFQRLLTPQPLTLSAAKPEAIANLAAQQRRIAS